MTRKLELPRTKEVEGLPVPLKVACVIRAADRAFPIAERFSSRDHIELIQRTVEVALDFATGKGRPYKDVQYSYQMASSHADSYTMFVDDALRSHATFRVQLDLRKGLVDDREALVRLSETSDFLTEVLPIWPGTIPGWFENPDLLPG